LVVGCTANPPTPDPGPKDSPERAAAELAAGLVKKDLTAVEFVGATGAEVNALLEPLVSGMGPLRPAVTVGAVNRQDDAATAALNVTWTFPGVPETWAYASEVRLSQDNGRWKTNWQPNIVQPQLDGNNRLSQRRVAAERGELRGAGDDPIVELRSVVRIGIDKSAVKGDAAAASARKLARLVDIDAAAYAKKVAGAGSAAFVEAIVFRADADERPDNDRVFAIKGALPIEDQQMLAPTRDFARPIIGTVGDATKEIVDDSGGAVVGGDQVGLSGLQRRYDEQLRGTPGVQVRLAAAKPTGPSASPSPTPSASPAPEPITVFEAKPTAGKPLVTTLDRELQELAERTLAKTKPASAIVAIRPSTGAVLAAANGPGTKDLSVATVGQDPPGSTFKVVSALALLRSGLKPSSSVKCPSTITVDGRRFKNYSDYPSGQIGTITLQTALAQSCNTAFIGQRGRLKGTDLADAAGSLGLGIDYDVGFSSFFGAVPEDSTATGRAAAMIGQGKVEASALAMASVVASVRAGQTVLPQLVEGQAAKPTGQPLTKEEATQLRQMMRAVVTEGSGRVLGGLDGPAVLAKTGTAEYGSATPLKTHVWMIAAQGDLAVAVFVNDGESGSQTAGPLLRRFLAGAA
jgi:hypothetical protein